MTDIDIKRCFVIGDPVTHSLSPVMHTAAFNAMGIEAQYSFQAEQVKAQELKKYIQRVKDKNIHMLAVTIPHKEAIIYYLDKVDPLAREIGAVNTVLNKNGVLTGYNTDCEGAIRALKQHTVLFEKNVLLFGSGGSARAIIYGLIKERAIVTICSRNRDKALELASAFGCKSLEWNERNSIEGVDIIVNTTPIGREGEAFPIMEGVKANHIVFDVNYNSTGTPLVAMAKQKGATAIDGLELLLQQGMLQFEMYTGLKAPEDAMRKALPNYKAHADAI